MCCRFLFWVSGGISPSIQRSDVTGQMKMTLIKITEQLRALSIDRADKRLFWVQFGLQGESAIASCDYNGNVLHIMNLPLRWAFSCIVIRYPSFNFCYWRNCRCNIWARWCQVSNKPKINTLSWFLCSFLPFFYFCQVSFSGNISFSGAHILHGCRVSGCKTSKQVHWRSATGC